MTDNKTHNPYDLSTYKTKPLKIFQTDDRKDMLNYKFAFEITGDNLDKRLLLSTGYIGQDIDDNYFILNEDEITKIVDQLNNYKEILHKSKKCRLDLDTLHYQLEQDLKAGYIESITIEYKKNSLPPYYDPLLYKAFIISPNYKKEAVPDYVNTAFNFLEVLRMDINEARFDEVMNHIRHHYDIPIHFIGYDYDEEVRKRQKQAMKELDEATKNGHVGYTDTERSKYSKMLKDMNIPFNVLADKKNKG